MSVYALESGEPFAAEDATLLMLEENTGAALSQVAYVTDPGGYAATTQTKSIALGSVALGDLIVVITYCPNASQIIRQPTVTGGAAVTWTVGPALPVSGSNSGGVGDQYAYVGLWTGVVTVAGSATLGMYKEFNEGYVWGSECSVWRGATLGAVSIYQDTPSTSSNGSLLLTHGQAASVVLYGSCDWVPVDGSMRTTLMVNMRAPTQTLYYRDPNFYTVYGYRYNNVGAPAQNRYGVSLPLGQRAAAIAVEIRPT